MCLEQCTTVSSVLITCCGIITLKQETVYRACVLNDDILNFYCTLKTSLPAYWSDDVEGVEKRALSIINPLAPFCDNLSCCKLSSLKERRCSLCEKLFNSIMLDSSHKLYKSLPQKNINTYNLRRPHHFKAYNARTNRFKNSFFSTMVKFFLGYL